MFVNNNDKSIINNELLCKNILKNWGNYLYLAKLGETNEDVEINENGDIIYYQTQPMHQDYCKELELVFKLTLTIDSVTFTIGELVNHVNNYFVEKKVISEEELALLLSGGAVVAICNKEAAILQKKDNHSDVDLSFPVHSKVDPGRLKAAIQNFFDQKGNPFFRFRCKFFYKEGFLFELPPPKYPDQIRKGE